MNHRPDFPESSVEKADPVTQLAVDLIYLLEINQIDPAIALQALPIIERDCKNKIERKKAGSI